MLSIVRLLLFIPSILAIANLPDLNNMIENSAMNISVGFLSEGNYHAVQNELSKKTLPKYFSSKDDLLNAVASGDVSAGLVSGTVRNTTFNVFGSEQISVRAMMVNQEEPYLLQALDAAIVRMIETGVIEEIATKNEPYDALVVHSCKAHSSHFDWPSVDLLNRKEIKIASLGPYDWGGTDGDYTTEPYVGFWPDYYRALESQFETEYGILFTRVWYKTSAEVLQSVVDGTTDATEPYMMVGSAYDGLSRKSVFDLSCITSATQDKYITLAPEEVVVIKETISIFIYVTIGIISSIAVGISILLIIMYFREKRGTPLFMPILTTQTTEV